MSLLAKLKIQFGNSEKEYGEEVFFDPTLIFECRFFDKKSVSVDTDDEFLNYDSTAVIDGYHPQNGDYCKLVNDTDRFYRVVSVSSLQTMNNSKQKFQIKLKLES